MLRLLRKVRNTLSSKPALSVVVIIYDMPEQALNTVRSLSANYQQGVAENEYEILVVENNSKNLVDQNKLKLLGNNIHYHLRSEDRASPVFAINQAVRDWARSEFVAIVIDGARVVTPGIIQHCLNALRHQPNATITVPSYHLGEEPQQKAVHNGYTTATEKQLLASIQWPRNGYKLFDIACFSGSSAVDGILRRIPESNFFALSKKRFDTLNGYDEGFHSFGGGYANLDIFKRATADHKFPLLVMIWEGTFHQYHGGATTGGDKGEREALMQPIRDQYIAMRGERFKACDREFEVIGKFNPAARKFIAESLNKF